ncbi:MAG: GlsB/YeaQ/YmgE family stress response membrane protein [Candidatus Binataceae bacterium]
MISAIIIGLIAGWLTGKLMRGKGYGIFADILLGLIGAVIGDRIFDAFGIVVYGGFGHLLMALVGAIVLVSIVHLVRSPSSQH